jgi:serine/threonine protein kinase
MFFQKDQRIRESVGRTTRWCVEDVHHDGTLTFLKLRDEHPDIRQPMVRPAVGVCINYCDNSLDEWQIQDWRRQFIEACEAASGNFAGLPEPIDFFRIRTTDREVPDHLRNGEPFLVYCYGQGDEVFPLNPKKVDGAATLAARIKAFVYDLAYILRALHQHGLVLRQLPLTSLRWLHSSRKYFLGEFLSLSKLGPSNYESKFPFLALEQRYCAPECFDVSGQLTPATDVFALGKALLMWLGRRFHARDPLRLDPALAMNQIDVKFRPMLPEATVRFLKLALQPDPGQRPQDMNDVMALITGREPRPPQRPQRSARPKHGDSRKPRF